MQMPWKIADFGKSFYSTGNNRKQEKQRIRHLSFFNEDNFFLETHVDEVNGNTKNISLKQLASEVFIGSPQKKLYSQKAAVVLLSAPQFSQVDSEKAQESLS